MFRTFLLILLTFASLQQVGAASEPPIARAGVIDLTSHDFERDGIVNLRGDYEFYWRRFLDRKELLVAEPTTFAYVPGPWNNVLVDGEPIGGQGYGTYRLQILISERRPLTLKLRDFGTAFRVLIDGNPVVKVGEPGTSASTTRARYVPQTLNFTPSGNRVELVFHVANFNHRAGGAWEPVQIGTPTAIENFRENELALDILIFGAIVMIGLYQLAFFTLRRDSYASLFIGLFCLVAGLRIVCIDERYLVTLFPTLPFPVYSKIEYLSWYLLLPLFAHFMQTQFPREIHRPIVWIIDGVSAAACLLVLLTPLAIYSWTVPLMQPITLAALAYGFARLVVAWRRHEDGAIILLLGYMIMFLCALNDVLMAAWIIETPSLAGVGIVTFIICQSLLVSSRHARSMRMVEQQTSMLETTWLKLRTQEKLRQKAEDESHEVERKFRESQQFEALGILAHGIARDLKRTFDATAAETEKIAQQFSGNEELLVALERTRQTAFQSVAVIEDLLSLSNFEGDHRRRTDLNKLVGEFLESAWAQDIQQTRSITFETRLAPDLPTISGTRLHVQRIIETLLANATNSVADGSAISISTDRHVCQGSEALYYDVLEAGEYAVLSVEDRGTTIAPAALDDVFQPFFHREENVTSGGLGMAIVRAVVTQLRGGIDVISEPGNLTRFDIYLPTADR